MKAIDKYQATIGLEIHAQLLTKTKAYSSDKNIYGGIPNTHTSVISLGHPGTLPKSNSKVIEHAITLGIAVGAKIREKNEYARKNYFYADLPKGYQITQDKTPICSGGFIEIKTKDNNKKQIHITRIHMEEDAGKSIHDLDPFNSLIDLNRAGVPLLEIVSEPEINSSSEAFEYVYEVKKLLKYLDICDGNMEEGSLRCDANISVRRKGETILGTKVEIKNMNSTRNIKKAIEFEIQRQVQILEQGKEVLHETRGFNANNNSTTPMRHKEKSNDYRYFPEPDLQPVIITSAHIKKIKDTLPPLPKDLFEKFKNKFNLSEYDAKILTEDKEIALYYNNLCNYTNNYKAAANFMNGSIKSYLNEHALVIKDLNLSVIDLAKLIDLTKNKIISNTVANNKVLPLMINSNKTAFEIANENNWVQESDTDLLEDYINQVIDKYPEEVVKYKNGKKGLLGLFIGKVMKLSKGKADPKLTSQLITKKLTK